MAIADLVERIKGNRALVTSPEEAIKQGAVLPVLSELGWDCYDITQVCPEYSVGTGRVDYCLRLNESNRVFIEAKRFGEELDRHQEQLLTYAFNHGVKLAVLTNGFVWWLYLPLVEGSWNQRRFIAIDFQAQDAKLVSDHLVQFIERERVRSGEAIKDAEQLHLSKVREKKARDTMPLAWQQLCEEPDDLLSELLSDKVESICGHRPSPDKVAEFLVKLIHNPASSLTPTDGVRPAKRATRTNGTLETSITAAAQNESYTFRKPVSYSFNGSTKSVTSYKEILVGVCNQLARRHGSEFQRLTALRGRKRPYFSTNPNEMHTPREIEGTGLYVETNLSANHIVQRLRDALELLGESANSLSVEARDNRSAES